MEIKNYLLIGMSFLMVVGSCALIYYLFDELSHLYKNILAKSWPKTTGKVIFAEVEEIVDDGITYKPSIKYSYTVNDTYYESTIYSFGMGSLGNKEISMDICAELNKQKNISVYYMAKNPENSLISPGVNSFNSRSIMWAAFAFIIFSPIHLIWVALYKYLYVWEK